MAIIQNDACMTALREIAGELDKLEDRAAYRLPEGRLNAVDFR